MSFFFCPVPLGFLYFGLVGGPVAPVSFGVSLLALSCLFRLHSQSFFFFSKAPSVHSFIRHVNDTPHFASV